MLSLSLTNCSLSVLVDLYNSTCLHEYVDEKLWPELYRLSSEGRVAFSIAYATLSVFAVGGNALVIYAVLHSQRMRASAHNVYVTNLAAANLLLALLMFPLLWLPNRYHMFTYDEIWCRLANALPASNIYCSTLTIAAMAIDRYYTVSTHNVMRSRASISTHLVPCAVAATIWVSALLLSSPLLISTQYTSIPIFNASTPLVPDEEMISLHKCNSADAGVLVIVIGGLQVFFLYLMPLVILLTFNLKLSMFLSRQAQALEKHREPNMSRASFLSIAESAPLAQRTNSKVSSSSTRSVQDEKQRRRQQRTSRLLLWMAASYAILWLPYTVITFVYDLGGGTIWPRGYHLQLDELAKLLSLCSVCVNPVLYGFMNSNFQREFRLIFCKAESTDVKEETNFEGTQMAVRSYNFSGLAHREQVLTGDKRSQVVIRVQHEYDSDEEKPEP